MNKRLGTYLSFVSYTVVYRIVALVWRFVSYRVKLYRCSHNQNPALGTEIILIEEAFMLLRTAFEWK